MLSFGDKRFRGVCLLKSNWPPEGDTLNITVVPLVEGLGFLVQVQPQIDPQMMMMMMMINNDL